MLRYWLVAALFIMDGVRSWSTFEQQPRDNNPSDGDDVTSSSEPGIDALYVSSSSSNIAPASATLLRHSGLTAPNNNSHSKDSRDNTTGGGEDEEFRLRFHWMRPHPSLAFALEEEILEGGQTDDNNTKSEKKKSKQTDNNNVQSNPAVEASKLMEAYRASQIKKQLGTAENTGGSASQDDDNTNKIKYNATNLPLELPKLRINLASLVEPPLMSSWLPGEDVDISYDDDDDEDDDREEVGR